MVTEKNSVRNLDRNSVLIFGEIGAGKSTILNTLEASMFTTCDLKGLT